MRAQDRRIIAAAKRQAAAKRKVVAKFARPALPFTASPDDLPADFGRLRDDPPVDTPADLNTRLWSADGESDDAPFAAPVGA